MSQGEVTDALTPFVLEHAAVRGAFVALPDTVAAILACHPYPPAVARVLSELCVACALLASTLKFKGTIGAQLSGDGPVRLLVVESTAALGMRAMAQWDDARVQALGPDAGLVELAGGPQRGRLVLTIDPKDGGAIYQGIVALEGASVGELIEHYLATSEQLASRMLLTTNGNAAAGLLVQRLPGATDSDDAVWTRIGTTLDALPPAALLADAAALVVIGNVLAHDDVRVFAPRPVTFACSCSRERVEHALRIAGLGEIESILDEKGFVDVTCEFCNRTYVFSPLEARAVLARGDTH